MSIRNAAKAVVVHDGKILLNRRAGSGGTHYYGLPGGGQAQYETMGEAVVRECLEETGYLVRPLRFVALYEEITDDQEVRRMHPDYSHHLYHMFLCELASEAPCQPGEMDLGQIGCEWVPVEDVHRLDLQPTAIRDSIPAFLGSESPLFLGSVRCT